MKKTIFNLSLFRSKTAVAALLALTVFTTGCKKSDSDDDTPAPTPTYGKLMAIHASTNASGVDLLVDNAVQNSTALTSGNTIPYFQIQSGSRSVRVNTTGTSTSLINTSVTISQDINYSLFVLDNAASVEPLVVTDDLTAPVSGKAKVRFVNLSSEPDVDVLYGTTVLFGDYSFKESSSFISLSPASYNLEVRDAGTTTVLGSFIGTSITAGKIYTIYIKGSFPSLSLQKITHN